VSRPFLAPVRISTGRLTIVGSSRAGNETYFRIRELNVALDVGRCPDILVGIPDVFLTHAHLDHALGVPFYAAQRKMQRLEAGNVYVPQETAEGFAELMALHERLEETGYPLNIVGLAEGEVRQVRRNLRVRAHRSTHRVVTNAYELIEVRWKLDERFVGMPGHEIERLRQEMPGELLHEEETPLLFYTGDTDRRIFDRSPALFGAEVLMIECSFTAAEDRQRALKYAHIHIGDIYDVAERFANETIVLTHFSLRDTPEDVQRQISRSCPAVLRERLRLALPEPYDRVI
jgi:ribonuclease Z